MAHSKTVVVDAMIEAGVLTGDLKKVTVDTLRTQDKTDKQWLKLADTYHGKGITAAMLATAKKGGIEKLREAVRATCAFALDDADLALYNKESKAIEAGSAINHLRAECVGETLTLYVNGQLVAQVRDLDFPVGDVGLFAGTYGAPGTDIRFDNFVVREP